MLPRGQDLPPVRVTVSPPNWNEEIAPTFSTRSLTPVRRFTVSITPNAFFPDSQLIDYTLPYRSSAGRYVKEFFGLQTFYAADDGRKGEFTIEIPDRRGAIRFAGGLVSIRDPLVPLRLVGTINGDIPIDVRNETTVDYDEEGVYSVELSLLTQENELVDYISTTDWPYKYPLPQEGAQEQQRLGLIRRGESEICEFKPYIDLVHEKAADLEKSVCAFSNQRGGTLFVGVDKDAEIVVIPRSVARRPEDVEKAVVGYEKRIRERLQESLKDNQRYTLQTERTAGQTVFVLTVTKSPNINFVLKRPHANIAFIRHGATSMKLTPTEMEALVSARLAQRRDF
jgi:Putative DNA-binding domain